MKMKMKMTFNQWMAKVNEFVIRRSGLSVYDLPDCCFRDWYETGVSASSAASKALKAARE